MPNHHHDIQQLFAAGGPLAQAVPGYIERTAQVEMAAAVADAIDRREALIVEAGTGTGKTFAYLAPALLWGGKVIVSTGTKTLQDQLFSRDLPRLRDALGVPVTIALLKGRANYVCHWHTERATESGRLSSRQDVGHLRKINFFLKTTRSGDKAELTDVPEHASVWNLVTSTRDNCLGGECSYYKDCFVMKARRDAQQADVVVVNHHLFFADVMLRDEGVNELLPAANTVIFDEAHQLPDTATMFFGESISTGQLFELCRDTQVEGNSHARDATPWAEAVAPLERAARDLRLAFGPSTQKGSLKLALSQVAADSPFFAAFEQMKVALAALQTVLVAAASRAPSIEQLSERATAFARLLDAWPAKASAEHIAWIDVFASSVQLHRSPLSVAPIFTKERESYPRAWIFTSATLAVKGDFHHYAAQMGLTGATALSWPSPFDYAQQGLLYVPPNMPEPHQPGYIDAVVDQAWPLIEAAGGRAFLLCTTLRAVERAAELLHERLAQSAISLFKQGDAGRTELLERFRSADHAVLIGSQSFWEGVDVRGEALSLVVIDKLPFAPPDDPILAARLSRLQAEGGNPFMDYQVPTAIIALKQGAGRLIRGETDRGVLMICDPRLISKPYGRRIWQSLPPFKRTRDVAEAIALLHVNANEQALTPVA